MSENAENVQTAPVAPAPVTPAPAKVETIQPAVTPVDSHTEEAKLNSAFAAMRVRAREAERKLAAISNVAPVPPPVTPSAEQAQTPIQTPTPAPVPVNKTEIDIETESRKAMESLANDKEVQQAGAFMDIVTMVDNEPRFIRLHNVDPVLAFQQAKIAFMAKAGISAPPPMAKPTNISGGTNGRKDDLGAMYSELDNYNPDSKEWKALAKRIKEANK